MEKKTITIKYKFGSDFQKETALTALDRMVEAWSSFYSSTHKKNNILIDTNQTTDTVSP